MVSPAGGVQDPADLGDHRGDGGLLQALQEVQGEDAVEIVFGPGPGRGGGVLADQEGRDVRRRLHHVAEVGVQALEDLDPPVQGPLAHVQAIGLLALLSQPMDHLARAATELEDLPVGGPELVDQLPGPFPPVLRQDFKAFRGWQAPPVAVEPDRTIKGIAGVVGEFGFSPLPIFLRVIAVW